MSRLLKLDRMEILGFKSFYGRTRFEFPDGITAVVGPNGCGKSNIGDAISWVLGEQKASSLRSDRMEDVIFNGSQNRRPLGMAEVSLHFRNLAHDASGGSNGGGGNGNGHGAEAIPGDGGEGGAAAAALLTETQDAGREPVSLGIPAAVDGPADAETEPAATPESGPHPRFFALEEIPEEVVVTRRLYRSGESEYSLNGQRCRLRDVQDLLTRTDVGSRLYSTIEQGKIDQILTARPKDRRAIFEEAAGILGYKTKRRQAEAKLEATRANLLRIADIVAEVEKQILSLKRQAAKARRYRRLLEDLRDRRLQTAHRRLLLLDQDRRSTLAALDDLRAREAAAAADVARQEADLETLRLRLDENEEAARQRRERIHALDLDLDRMQERLRAGETLAQDLAARAAEAERDLAALAARESGHEARRAALEAEAATAGTSLRDAEERRVALEEDLRQRRAAVEAGAARETQEREEWQRLVSGAAETERRRAGLEEQQRSHDAALERIGREADDLGKEQEAITAALAEDDEQARLAQARLDALEGERRETAAAGEQAAMRVERAGRLAEDLRAREAVLSERFATLEGIVRRHAGAPAGLAAVLEGAAGFRPAGIVGEGLEVEAGFERAAEAALAGLAEAVLVREIEDASRGVSHLREIAGGRVSFVAAARDEPGAQGDGTAPQPLPGDLAEEAGPRLLDCVRGALPPPVCAVLARSLVVDDLEHAVRLARRWPGWIFVSRAGDRAESGVVTGGDGRALDSGLLLRRADLAEVETRVAATADERRQAEEEAAAARRDADSIRERLAWVEARIRDEERGRFERDVMRGRRRADRDRIEVRLPVVVAERARLRRAREETVATLALLAEDAAGSEARRGSAEEAMRLAAEALAARRIEAEGTQGMAAEAGATAAALAERLEALGRERTRIEEAVAELRETMAGRSAARAEFLARSAALADEAAALRVDQDRTRAERAEAAAQDEAAHAGLAYDRSLRHAREQGVREGRAAHAEVRDRLQEAELHLARADAQVEALETLCREDLETTVETLRVRTPPPPDDRPIEDREREIESLKAEIHSMGAVNLMAIEQHAELEERFTDLAGQKKDLEDSIAMLQESIRKMNRQSRERFLAAFEAIQRHFQDTFRTLFGGGQAELRLLDDEGDVLEAGIEIVAQPPGKKLQKIALLSGGEKALTAASLLFSLFRYRPSPFCVLDEVDAPLDEANVERFTRLLQDFRRETQFILITHNRKSMEAADLLYGVTMEEPGVSKVLPLRFE